MTKRKIVYGAGDRSGAAFQLQQFLAHTSDIVRTAAYVHSSLPNQVVNWTLNACAAPIAYRTLVRDINRFNPDLIISDGEPFVAFVANELSIPLWKCSPLHLIDGALWEKSPKNYSTILRDARKFLKDLPEAARTFVYSPFCDIQMRPHLKEGVEWVKPYYKNVTGFGGRPVALIQNRLRNTELSNLLKSSDASFSVFSNKNEAFFKALTGASALLSTGETDSFVDAFYGEKNICIAPTVGDAEAAINALACESFEIGVDLGQIELMGKYAFPDLDKAIERLPRKNFLSIQNRKTLNEMVEEL